MVYDILKTGGWVITYAETQEFSSCIQTLQISELTWKEDYNTWSNKQHRPDRVSSRIDSLWKF